MKISVRARYALSAMICIARDYDADEYVAIINLAERLKISKIYLEQVFSLLKRAELVVSAKGAQGGYQLARKPKNITVLDLMSAIETSLFEKTESTVPESDSAIEKTMQTSVFDKLDSCIAESLSGVSIADLVLAAEKESSNEGYMYYL